MFRRRPIASSSSVESEQGQVNQMSKKRISCGFGLFSFMKERRQVVQHFPFPISSRLKMKDLKGTSFHFSGFSVGRKIHKEGSQQISFGVYIRELRRRNWIFGRLPTSLGSRKEKGRRHFPFLKVFSIIKTMEGSRISGFSTYLFTFIGLIVIPPSHLFQKLMYPPPLPSPQGGRVRVGVKRGWLMSDERIGCV